MKNRKKDPLEDFRNEVRKEILKKYSTVEEFCWDKDLNKATMSNFFNNRKDFRISTLVQIAEALDYDLLIKLKSMN